MKFEYKSKEKERLDKWLAIQLPDMTRSHIKKIILAGLVTVNDQDTTVHRWLKNGDKIDYDDDKSIKKPAGDMIEPLIIEQNEEYIILEKPHALLIHPTDQGETNTMADWLVNKFPKLSKIGDDPTRPGIVHRLDKEVSGLVVIALTQDSFDNLKKQFQDRTIKKEYTALIHGKLINDKGEINTPIERDKKTGLMKVQTAKDSGKIALTLYQVTKKFINYTLVKVIIKTGRMHQIRAHFYSIGHSIIGDKLYKTKDIRKKKKVLTSRIFLHADYLKFKNLAGELREYRSALPQELEKLLDNIK